MTDWWSTASLLATGGGTLALAGATFASMRSANRAARATERALLAGIRPVLMPSRLQDPPEKVMFQDYAVKVDGGRATAELANGVIYLAMTLRNVGNGLAVLDRWDLRLGNPTTVQPPRDPSVFHRLTRDIYISNGDLGFWQGALRDPTEPLFAEATTAIDERQPMTVDLLYGDHEGGQRTITRFAILPASDGQWLTAVSRHWNIDRADPR